MATWMEIGPTENKSQQAKLIQIRYMSLELRRRLQKQRSTPLWHQPRRAERKSKAMWKRKQESESKGESLPPSTARKWSELGSNKLNGRSCYTDTTHWQSGTPNIIWSKAIRVVGPFSSGLQKGSVLDEWVPKNGLFVHTHSPLNEKLARCLFWSVSGRSVMLKGSASRVRLPHTCFSQLLCWMYVHAWHPVYSVMSEIIKR